MMTTLYDECLAIQCGATTQEQAGVNKLVECAQNGQVGTRVPWDPACAQFNGARDVVGPVPVPNTMLVQPLGVEPTMVNRSQAPSAYDLMLVLPQMPTSVGPPSTGPGSPCEGGYGVGLEDKEAGMYGWGGAQGQGQDSDSSLVCQVGNWASDNPVLAGVVLVGTWWALGGKHGRKGR